MIGDLCNLPSVIAGAEVCGDEVLHSRFLRNAGGIFHCRMLSVAGHIGGVRTEGRLMNESCTIFGEPDRTLRKLGIQTIRNGFSRTRGAENHVRRNDATVSQSNRFTVLKLSVQRSARNAQFFGPLEVEDSGFVLLLEAPSQAEDRMVER